MEQKEVANDAVTVIDTNVFIKHPNLRELVMSTKVVTTTSVLAEIRDPQSRLLAKELFKDYKIRNPLKQAVNIVKDFAIKTGDLGVLSKTDIEVIAAAVEIIVERGLLSKLNSAPKDAENVAPRLEKEAQDAEDQIDRELTNNEENPEENQCEDQEQGEAKQESSNETLETEPLCQDTQCEDQEQQENQTQGELLHEHKVEEDSTSKANKMWVEGRDFDKDEEDGWITKDNYRKMQDSKSEYTDSENELGVAIMTSDFAMQNIILQMGIPLLSADGMRITKIKSYVLECFTCNHITKDTTKKFCPKCKYDTLLRVTCTFESDGSLILYRKKNYQVNMRGRKYNIPNPTFGRHNNDLILTEDQLNQPNIKNKIRKAQRYQEKQMKIAETNFGYGWGIEELTKDNKHFRTYEVGYGKKNPNDNSFWKGKSKKGKRK